MVKKTKIPHVSTSLSQNVNTYSRMAKKSKSEPEVYTNRTALSVAKGIPIAHIKAAKALSCDGIKPNGRIYWVEFEPWYKKNLPAITEYLEDNVASQPKGYWKDRKDKAQALIADIQLLQLQGDTLIRASAISSVNQMLGSMAIQLKNIAQDYPHKLLGKGITEMQVELSKAYDEICSKGLESLSKWKNPKQ
jgi:hypothetical protein